jgi:hypothetical protein
MSDRDVLSLPGVNGHKWHGDLDRFHGTTDLLPGAAAMMRAIPSPVGRRWGAVLNHARPDAKDRVHAVCDVWQLVA